MKFKQKLKKGWSILETVIVLAVTAILAGVSVGIYFGVTTQDPETAAVTVQQQVVDLWESHINNGTEFSSDIEAKAREFCTGYIEERGTNVPLNYRVLEFDTYVSAIPNESETSRAYDPSGNAKEAVIIKIDTLYPSYFISTASSVLKLSPIFETERLLNEAVINDNYVSYSGVLDDYGITSADDDFTLFYELTDVNYNGKVVRGIKYVRYNVLNANNEVYATVFGRANRSLDGDCEGEYLPKSFAITMGNSIFHTSTFRLIETRGEEKYNYDPDHIYEYGDDYLEGKETYQVFEGKDANGNDIVTNKVAPISVVNDEYITGEKTINFYPTLTTGNGDKDQNGGTGNGDKEEPDIDIYNPLDPDDDPSKPGNGTGNGSATVDPEANIGVYPITLAFAEPITPSGLGETIIAWFKSWFGIYDFTFKYLYFSNLGALNEFINTPTYGDLLDSISEDNRISYLHFAHGFEIDTFVSIPEDFVVFVDDAVDNTSSDRTAHIDDFIEEYKDNDGAIDMMEDREWGREACDPYKVHWPATPNKLVHITESGILRFNNNAKLYVESDAGVTSWDYKGTPYGWKVKSYGEINNDGLIQLLGNSSARITGIVSGSGRIVASSTSTISEPLKITDFFGKSNTQNAYIGRNIFPSDFYYLDSIRCNLVLSYGARYVGLVAIQETWSGMDHTFFGKINLISSKMDDSLFVMKSESQVVKSCDNNGKTTIDVVQGELVYSHDLLNTQISSGVNDGASQVGYKEFDTKDTGFKLSNINLLVRRGAKFTMPGMEYNGGNTGYPRLEVLPSSRIHIYAGGTLNMGKNSYIYITNYFDNDAVHYDSNGNTPTNGAFADVAINKNGSNSKYAATCLAKMWQLATYYNATDYMFVNEGVINQDLTRTVIDSSTKTYKKDCEHTHYVWPIDYPCVGEIIYQGIETVKYIQSSIYSWSYNKITNVKGSIKSFTISGSAVRYGSEWHNHTTADDKNNYDNVYPIYEKGFNDVAYGYGGDASTCWCYPGNQLIF